MWKHKMNVERIMRQDGFCAGFRYDLIIRCNAFQCEMFRGDVKIFPDISVLREKEVQAAYSEARANDELRYSDNPYLPGKEREEWDPITGKKKYSTNKRRHDGRQRRSGDEEEGGNRGFDNRRGNCPRQNGYGNGGGERNDERDGGRILNDRARDRARNFQGSNTQARGRNFP